MADGVAIVVDASLVVSALMGEQRALDCLAVCDEMMAPAHLDAEIGHALRGLIRGGVLTADQAYEALDRLDEMPLERIELHGLMHRALELRENMTFYDALYIALAEARDATLVVADHKFGATRRIGCPIELV